MSSGSFDVTGLPSASGTLATTLAPCAAAMFSATFARSAKTCLRMSSSNVRIVPVSSTWSGMMLKRTPPAIEPKLTTTGSLGMFWRRLTIV